MVKDIVYWDANCFLALLNKETEKITCCQGVMKKAESGELLIVTSALTLIEVVKMKGKPKLTSAVEKTIRGFFENSFIYIQNVDRDVGIKARELMWKHEALAPKDSIHVATAILRKVPKLHTFDEYLISLDGKYGTPKLNICRPDVEYQMDFEDLNGKKTSQDQGQQDSPAV